MLWPNLNSPGVLVENVGHDQRCLKLCEKSNISGLPRGRRDGWEGPGLRIYFRRSQPYLCCGQI